jgi:hypothetical protein
MQQYKTVKGVIQWKPSIEEIEDADANLEGFCLHCGDTVPGVDPDARQQICEICQKPKVYGPVELVMMGLYH